MIQKCVCLLDIRLGTPARAHKALTRVAPWQRPASMNGKMRALYVSSFFVVVALHTSHDRVVQGLLSAMQGRVAPLGCIHHEHRRLQILHWYFVWKSVLSQRRPLGIWRGAEQVYSHSLQCCVENVRTSSCKNMKVHKPVRVWVPMERRNVS